MKLQKTDHSEQISWSAVDKGRVVCYAYRKAGRKTIHVRASHFVTLKQMQKFLEFVENG